MRADRATRSTRRATALDLGYQITMRTRRPRAPCPRMMAVPRSMAEVVHRTALAELADRFAAVVRAGDIVA
ncbi:MAG TPA: hypothetical protein VFZ03_00250 [Dongiaceae bacterium]